MLRLFGQFLNNERPVRRSGLMHELQAIILMNARVLGNGSSLTAVLQTDGVQGSGSGRHPTNAGSLYSLLSSLNIFLDMFDAQ